MSLHDEPGFAGQSSMARTCAVEEQKGEIMRYVRRVIELRGGELSVEGEHLLEGFSSAIAEILVRGRP